jgi:serine/threonine-protein kinase
MGEVYRARDTRLNRDVAIKVLPAAVAGDSERLTRFTREAQVLASLNHPSIAAIYGMEESGETKALILEIVEGPTLADRIARGPVPLEEAIPIARQIAEALEAAHERGIVHRDLKPANIKVRPDGAVKVLDFGLAKALDPSAAPDVDATSSPTMTALATKVGIVLGTAAYMAPEQAKGKPVDKRADIWAFGVVLYEMLTGRRLFSGETPSEVLAAVILKEPDLTGLPGATPPAVRRLLARCLDKDPMRRLRDIGEARVALLEPPDEPARPQAGVLRPEGTTGSRPGWFAWTAGALALALVVALVLLGRAMRPEDRPVARLDVQMPARSFLNLGSRPALALSRDGESLVFTATSAGVSRLYVRRRAEEEARPLIGTEGASNPTLSPDGKWIAFFAGGKLKKVTPEGSVVTLAAASEARGLTWTDDGNLVYTPQAIGPLYLLPANGGEPRPVTTVDTTKEERSHRWPEALPGGKTVLFTVGTLSSPDNYDGSTIAAANLATGERRVVLEGAGMVRYVSPGYLVFARAGSLYAVGFDPERLAVRGSQALVVRGVAGDTPTGAAHYSCSDEGTLAYAPGSKLGDLRRIGWVDREGAWQPIDLPPALYNDLRISPDGTRAAIAVGASGSADVWVYDFGRKTFTRLTFNGTNATPVWSSDGTSILYASIDSTGRRTALRRVPADGSREPVEVGSAPTRAYVADASRDGGSVVLVYINVGAAGKADVVRLSLGKDAVVSPIAASPFDEYTASSSPDGRWVAYQSDESSRNEIYVRDSAGAGGRWQISTDGGEEPMWSSDGRELYYRSETRFMAVSVETRARFEAGTPRVLFDGAYQMRSDSGISYDVDPKGGRFLMIRPAEESDEARGIRIVLNWSREVRRTLAGTP